MKEFDRSRRDFLKLLGTITIIAEFGSLNDSAGQDVPDIFPSDRVFIANEDSNTISVINPLTNTIDTTINLTSFDEDPRPPFRYVTAGVRPTHGAMIHKPLYHGCIDAHGVVPSPDGRMLATSGRGSSNVYLIDTINKKVIGNRPNPLASKDANPERITSGIIVGREPHEPTFTRNGKELWVAVRGEDRIAILDVELAIKESSGENIRSVLQYINTINGPSQVWFSADGRIAFVASQKVSKIDIFKVNPDGKGYSHPERFKTLDISEQDKFGFTPFLKTSPNGKEVWFSHKLMDAVSTFSTEEPFGLIDHVFLGKMARPNHLEFVENKNGKVVYVSFARVDDGGPGGVASSQIAIIDRSEPSGKRKVIKTFFSRGREAHGLWTNPTNKLLYIAHEQDELPGTPNEGQTVATAFDVSDPFNPRFVAQIPLGSLGLPSGELRNKKSINLVYVRPGFKGQTA
ncbi:MAG: beta-propeller fold lactonase family protein [Thermodesulfovibrionales bacterium]